MRLGAHERDGLAEAEPAQTLAQRRLVAVERLVGVAAHDRQPCRRAARAQARHGVEQGLQALDRRLSPDVEELRLVAETERGARRRLRARREELGVHAARDDRDARGIGAVVADEMRALHHGGGDDAIGGADDARFLGDAHVGLAVGAVVAGVVLQPPQRVEHLHERHGPPPAQRQAHGARQPVVRVDQVVVGAGSDPEGLHTVHELVEVLEHALARHGRLRAGRQVHDAHALGQRHDPRDRRVLRAREDVGLHAHARQLAGQLAHVHVHAARLLAAQRGQRTGVHAEHRDPQAHGCTWGAPRWPPTPPDARSAPGNPWRSSMIRRALTAAPRW